MKKILLFIITSFLALNFLNTAYAHDFAENGTATLLIHIDPDEVGISGKPITFFINLKNSEKGFDIEKCSCVFTVNQVMGKDEKEILSVPLISSKGDSEFNAQGIPFTFPTDGEYHLNITANPTTINLFKPFEVEVKEKVLPIGTVLPFDTTMAISHTHTHAYPRVELAMAGIFTIVMGYFLFAKNKVK